MLWVVVLVAVSSPRRALSVVDCSICIPHVLSKSFYLIGCLAGTPMLTFEAEPLRYCMRQ